VSSEPAAGGPQQWFEYYDDTVVGDPCSEADHAFLAGLRARAVARAWPCEAWDTFCDHDDELGKRALKVGVWLDDPRDFQSFNKVFREYFGANPPARACVVSSMVVDCKVEIECVAFKR